MKNKTLYFIFILLATSIIIAEEDIFAPVDDSYYVNRMSELKNWETVAEQNPSNTKMILTAIPSFLIDNSYKTESENYDVALAKTSESDDDILELVVDGSINDSHDEARDQQTLLHAEMGNTETVNARLAGKTEYDEETDPDLDDADDDPEVTNKALRKAARLRISLDNDLKRETRLNNAQIGLKALNAALELIGKEPYELSELSSIQTKHGYSLKELRELAKSRGCQNAVVVKWNATAYKNLKKFATTNTPVIAYFRPTGVMKTDFVKRLSPNNNGMGSFFTVEEAEDKRVFGAISFSSFRKKQFNYLWNGAALLINPKSTPPGICDDKTANKFFGGGANFVYNADSTEQKNSSIPMGKGGVGGAFGLSWGKDGFSWGADFGFNDTETDDYVSYSQKEDEEIKSPEEEYADELLVQDWQCHTTKGVQGNSPDATATDDAPEGFGMPVHKVNHVTLNVRLTDTPLVYNSPIGPPIEITAYYNDYMCGFKESCISRRWMLNYDSFYFKLNGGDTLVFIHPDSLSQKFHKRGNRWKPAKGNLNSLEVKDNYFVLTEKDSRTEYWYEKGAKKLKRRLAFIKDKNGNSLTFAWGNWEDKKKKKFWKLMAITNAVGEATTFTYEKIKGRARIVKVTAPNKQFCVFGYNNVWNNSNEKRKKIKYIIDMGGYTNFFRRYTAAAKVKKYITPYGLTFISRKFGTINFLKNIIDKNGNLLFPFNSWWVNSVETELEYNVTTFSSDSKSVKRKVGEAKVCKVKIWDPTHNKEIYTTAPGRRHVTLTKKIFS